MKRILVAQMLSAVLSLSACSGGASGPGADPGWTGVTRPQDVIAARFKLMEQIEQLMLPIDNLQVQAAGDTKLPRTNAAAIAAMLQAVPHLFPPTTNLYDPKVETPATIALPAIWKDFPTFDALAGAAASAARDMAVAEGADQQRGASARLRASCDACHVLFLRKYEKPAAKASDAEFDFDAALPGK